MNKSRYSRREFFRMAGVGVGGLLLAARSSKVSAAFSPLTGINAFKSPENEVAIELTAQAARVDLLPGAATRVWQYQGPGDSASLQIIPDSYLGPILRLQQGQNLRLRFNNNIPDKSIIHWHGLSVPDEMDGHPHTVIPQGQGYDYEFPILNRAGTYWYHPHPHGRTGPQAYYGLAGLLIVSDEQERALGLPAGELDLPLVIQDRSFDRDNQLVYVADTMNGFFGDRVLVNGQSRHTWKVQARPYRLRLLNGSNARIYKLAWSDNQAMTVIASDGGLLEKPVQRPYITLAPGERLELWADFSAYGPGQELRLKSLPFEAGGGGMMGMMGSSGLPQGSAMDVLSLQIVPAADGEKPVLPQRLSDPGFNAEQDAVNRSSPRRITLAMQHMTGTLNGRTFEMDEVAADEIVRIGDLEIWEFINTESGMGMMGGSGHPHPMHIHGVQFQVLDRQVNRQNRADYESVSAGFVDEGWKDTLLVWPGETVRLLVRFEPYTGMYLYHCHNLEHEDGGMMRNYQVES